MKCFLLIFSIFFDSLIVWTRLVARPTFRSFSFSGYLFFISWSINPNQSIG